MGRAGGLLNVILDRNIYYNITANNEKTKIPLFDYLINLKLTIFPFPPVNKKFIVTYVKEQSYLQFNCIFCTFFTIKFFGSILLLSVLVQNVKFLSCLPARTRQETWTLSCPSDNQLLNIGRLGRQLRQCSHLVRGRVPGYDSSTHATPRVARLPNG